MENPSLQDFVESVTGTSHLRVEVDYGGGFVRLNTSEAERRQAAQDIRCCEDVVLELLRNSRDAYSSNIFVALSRTQGKRRMAVVDDGVGIPPAMHALIFEPRVTSKLDTSHTDTWGLHGRGMALYSIAMNTEYARVASSDTDLGCAIDVCADTSSLAEKADQSSFPTFELDENGTVNVRGPKNLLRTICEFAIQSRKQCSVYAGSPAEICAALLAEGAEGLSVVDRLFCSDRSSLPVTKRLAACNTPREFSEQASLLGMPLSERTARRIIDGSIQPAERVLDRVRITSKEPQSKAGAKSRTAKRVALHLTEQDKQTLAESAMQGFAAVAPGYYLSTSVDPRVSVKAERITISIPIVQR